MDKRNKLVKAATVALLAVCMMATAACGQKPTQGEAPQQAAANTGGTPGDIGGTKQAEAPKTTTAADVFTKSMEAAAKLESFSVNMNVKQTIEQAANKMDMQSKIDMDVVMKPQLSFKQTLAMNMMGQDVKLETYLTKDGVFMREPKSGQWMRLPKEQTDQLMSGISEDQVDPSKQLQKLKQFTDDLTMTESGDDYVIKLSANGAKFNDFLKNEMKQYAGNNPGLEQLLDQNGSAVNFKKMDYTFAIDKKSLFPKTMQMNMEFEMDAEGQKVNMVQNLEGTYANYNAVKSIELPKEALDAQPIGATR